MLLLLQMRLAYFDFLMRQFASGGQQFGPTARNTSPSPRGGAAGPVDAETKILSSEQRAPKCVDRVFGCVLLNIAEFVQVSRELYELSPSRAKRFEWRSTTCQLPPSGTRILKSRLANWLTLTLALASLCIGNIISFKTCTSY